jgi:MFS family permease
MLMTMLSAFRNRYLSALQYSDYRWVWLGSMSSQSAYWALLVARGVLVLEMTGSSALVGVTTFAAMVPRVIIPPLAGFLADRFDRRKVLATSYVFQMMHGVVLTVLAYAGVLEVWHIVVLSLVNGSFRTFQMTAVQALTPNLVPREHWLNAIAMNQLTQQGSRLVGPGLVAPAMLLAGPEAAFAVSTLFYVAGIAGVLAIRTRASGGLERGSRLGASLLEAGRYAWGHPQLRVMFILVALHCSMTMAFESTLPVLARDELGLGMGGVSYLMMAVGAGAVLAVFAVAGSRNAVHRGRILLVTGLASGASMAGLAAAETAPLALLAAAVMGGSQASFMAVAGAMIQSLAPDSMRGRITGLNQINVGGTMALVNLVNGIAADWYGAPVVLTVMGLGFVGVAVASLLIATMRGVYGGDIALPARAS